MLTPLRPFDLSDAALLQFPLILRLKVVRQAVHIPTNFPHDRSFFKPPQDTP
jgi:hypothetical protein